MGSLFEVVASSTNGTEFRHNIMADGQVVAVHTITSTGVPSTDYLHYDHLGSVNATTNTSGSVIQSMSFDAFGQRRLPTDWDYGVSQDTLTTLKNYTDRGYTGEEELDSVSLVDLNGRVYDPTTGRFISADPVMGGNRYAYAYNNPLEFTDPSGYCGGWLSSLCDPIQNGVNGLFNTVAEEIGHLGGVVLNHAPEVAALVAAYYTGTASVWASGFWGSVEAGAAAGGTFAGTDTALRGGNANEILDSTFRGGAVGAVGGGLLYGANVVTSYSGDDFGVGVVSHGVAGGLTSEAAGGNFNSGFELGGLAYTAYWGYQQMVGQAPRWTGGQGTTPKAADYPPWDESQDVINFGRGVPAGFSTCALCEGGTFSDVMNAYPGMNALATLHDILGDFFVDDVYGSYPIWFNVGTMLPAAVFTYSALLNTTIGYGIVAGDDVNRGGR